MVDITSSKQYEEVEMDDDEVQEDEVQIVDITTPNQREEEDKGQK